jgi:DNA-binding CsgD family transcriptional regulator
MLDAAAAGMDYRREPIECFGSDLSGSPEETNAELLERFAGSLATARANSIEIAGRFKLTESELRVLRYLPTRLTRSEIARQLLVTVNTVNTHVRNIYSKLDAQCRTEAVERAMQLRLLVHPIWMRRNHHAWADNGRVHRHEPKLYSIRVSGHLGAMSLAAFPEMVSQQRGCDCVLTGLLGDRSALFGVLAQIEALGLDLIEVRRLVPRLPESADKKG